MASGVGCAAAVSVMMFSPLCVCGTAPAGRTQQKAGSSRATWNLFFQSVIEKSREVKMEERTGDCIETRETRVTMLRQGSEGMRGKTPKLAGLAILCARLLNVISERWVGVRDEESVRHESGHAGSRAGADVRRGVRDSCGNETTARRRREEQERGRAPCGSNPSVSGKGLREIPGARKAGACAGSRKSTDSL